MTETVTETRDYAAQLDTLSELNDRVREIIGRIRGHAIGKEPFAQALKDNGEVSEELGALLVEMILPADAFRSDRLRRAQEAVRQIIIAAGLSSVALGEYGN